MGLCPSRNSKASSAKLAQKQTFTPLEPAAPAGGLRADARAFVPKPAPAAKEAWEQFLDQKQQDHQQQDQQQPGKAFNRKTDGTFTQDYRKLLGGEPTVVAKQKQRYVPPQQRGGGDADWIQEWKHTGARKPAFRPPPGLPATRAPPLTSDDKLKAAMLKVKQMAPPPSAVLEQLRALHAKAAPKDDAAAPSALVPFGLTDAHYLSDDADGADSHRHCSSIRTKLRSYVPKPPSAALEESMTRVLRCLKQLKAAETASGLEEAKRYCVGIREVARILKDKQNCSLKAVLVAPDVEAGGTTARGSLDDRLQELIDAAAARNIPVIYGLSRTRLGQAIKKSVTISVLGVLSVRGMQEPFEQMLQRSAA